MARAIDAYAAIDMIDEWLDSVGTVMVGKGLSSYGELIGCIEYTPTLTPPNEPLTIKQLQKMVGEPVYDYLGQEWYVIQEYYDHELTMTDGTRFFDDDEIDGVDKRFSRRPPEGEEDT